MKAVTLILLLPLTLSLAQDTELSEQVDIQMVTVDDSFRVAGMEYQGKDPAEVAVLWDDLLQRLDELPGVQVTDPGYGILLDYDDMSGEFTYMAAVVAEAGDPPPEGMRELVIPAGDYAVFTFDFSLLPQVSRYAYQEWLPLSDYVAGDGYDFEYYPADFDPAGEAATMQIFVSVKEQ